LPVHPGFELMDAVTASHRHQSKWERRNLAPARGVEALLVVADLELL